MHSEEKIKVTVKLYMVFNLIVKQNAMKTCGGVEV
jgi:hypothetical protein